MYNKTSPTSTVVKVGLVFKPNYIEPKIKYKIKKKAMKYIVRDISFLRPTAIFRIGYAMNPKAIPLAMLKLNGMIASIK